MNPPTPQLSSHNCTACSYRNTVNIHATKNLKNMTLKMLHFVLLQLHLLKIVFWNMEAYKLLIGADVSEKFVVPISG